MSDISDSVDVLQATNANLVTVLQGLQGTLQDAVDAGQGPQGWSPVLTVQSDGARRVLQVTDWTGGGTGATKPDTGDYIGESGLEPLIGDAIDIRGDTGADGNDGADGTGWTGATYDSGTGVITFTSDDGLGFATDDLRGEKGDPGAMFDWTGPWVTSTAYTEGQGVENDGSSYVCTSDHTSGASTEPGVGGSWQTVWDLSAAKGDPGAGSGDMQASTYDPQSIEGDAFDRANHTGTQPLSTISDAGTAAANDTGDFATAAQGALADTAQQPPSEGAFVDGDKTKLDGIEAGADVTDTPNVTAAGALMDSEVANLADVKAFDPADYATAAQGSTADTALQPGDAVEETGSTGSAVMPAGTEAQRDGSPSAGYLRFNTESGSFEGHDGSEWGDIGGAGGLSLPVTEVISTQVASRDIALPAGTGPIIIEGRGIQIIEDSSPFDPTEEPLAILTSTDGVTFDDDNGDYFATSPSSSIEFGDSERRHDFYLVATGANDSDAYFRVSGFVVSGDGSSITFAGQIPATARNAQEAVTHIRFQPAGPAKWLGGGEIIVRQMQGA